MDVVPNVGMWGVMDAVSHVTGSLRPYEKRMKGKPMARQNSRRPS